ncbi:MAG: hypothetical protein CUN56_01805 [Phototrophicales bacterium]|nr:MAG: hypothetical protein CUN56_01805 [Phototrophicales bacterium]RMG69945.1 MAG: N-acetyltransferase [Chloroflexota bacterium]
MSANIISIAQLQQRYSGSYQFTITQEPDLDFRKYLKRKLCDVLPPVSLAHPADAHPLDISLDDLEGDVVAGISAVTYRGTLYIDMLWVDAPLRHTGIGHRLVQMTEEHARQRGCRRARISVPGHTVAFFVGTGYRINGTVQPVDDLSHSVFWLTKDLLR